MGICESGQGLTAAAISSRPFVRWASHRPPAVFEANVVRPLKQPRRRVRNIFMVSTPASVATRAEDAGNESYKVVARRYRPQRFDELVGQEHVAKGLSGAIESGRIGHAYLFTGARGVGKTSAARIFAKALACATGPAAEPCNACDQCAAISAGQDVDVVEVDAASNRGVDEIRQLRQNVSVRPARGRYKTYIIDEVHMLTREAFNALLKTLEEPPAHVKFVLCTTEPEKLPITILSRCQRFDFVTVDTPAIARRLAQIVEAEGATAAPAALDLIARRAAGSMRDSQSLLEQLLGAAEGTIGVDEVHAIIGTGREEKIGRLIEALAARDPQMAIEAFDVALAGGADPGGVLEQLIAALRDSLLASVGCGAGVMQQGPELGVDLAAMGKNLGTETLLAMLQIIDHSLARMRLSGHAAVLAEIAIVRLATLENLESVASAVERVTTADSAIPPGRREKKTRVHPIATAPRSVTDSSIDPSSNGVPEVRATQSKNVSDTEPQSAEAALSATVNPSLSDLILASDAWQQSSKSMGGMTADFAATASRISWQGSILEVVLPAEATTALSFLTRPEIAAGLTKALSEMTGREVRQSILVDAPVSVTVPVAAGQKDRICAPREISPEVRDQFSSVPAETAKGVEPVVVAVSQKVLLREALEHPLVIHVQKVFDAAVRKVEPPRMRPAAIAAAARASSDVIASATAEAFDADADKQNHEADRQADNFQGDRDG